MCFIWVACACVMFVSGCITRRGASHCANCGCVWEPKKPPRKLKLDYKIPTGTSTDLHTECPTTRRQRAPPDATTHHSTRRNAPCSCAARSQVPCFSFWISKLRIGVSAAVLMMVFFCESNGGDDSKQREPCSCAARTQVPCFSFWISKLRIGVSAAVLMMAVLLRI